MNPNYVPAVTVPVANPVAYPSAPAPFQKTSSISQAQFIDGQFNDGGAREFLSQHNWPAGLQDTFVKNLTKVAFRFFICDDSGSMSASDGHRLVGDPKNNQKLVACSRWSELTESLKFHASLARSAAVPAEFRLLNGAAPILVGTPDDISGVRYNQFLNLLENSPNGGTPLCRHIREVIDEIRGMEQQLRASGRKALVVIATDGESSDGNIAQAMRPLKDLPVWVVVRLCTDEDRIVNYWNSIDNELELDMDVLDDLCGEAAEIHEHNPFLTYGEPLHRLREFGIPVKELDLLDEAKLSLEQVRTMCCIVFGGRPDNYPHPEVDWKGFVAAVERENKKVSRVWSPIDRRPREWIVVDRLARHCKQGGGGCTIC